MSEVRAAHPHESTLLTASECALLCADTLHPYTRQS